MERADRSQGWEGIFPSDWRSEAAFFDQRYSRRDISASSDDAAFLDKFAHASAIELKHDDLGIIRVPLRSSAAAVEALRILRRCHDARLGH